MPLVECRLSKVVMSSEHDRQVIVLEEIDGARKFPISIGFVEVFAIHRFVNGQTPPRPFTHEFIGSILDALDVQVERVIVSDLREGTFYARLVARTGERLMEFDSRPSDGIALACRAHAPIFVEERVISEAAQDFD